MLGLWEFLAEGLGGCEVVGVGEEAEYEERFSGFLYLKMRPHFEVLISIYISLFSK